MSSSSEQEEQQQQDEGIEIQIDEATAAAIAEVTSMLRWRVNDDTLHVDVSTLAEQLEASAPLKIIDDTIDNPQRGRYVVATRDIKEGEVLLVEEATAVVLNRSPGSDAVFSMRDSRTGILVCTLPPWPAVRTFRDTFTLAPRFVGSAETAYATLSQLTAYGERDHQEWSTIPECPPGIDDTIEENIVPRRAQLLHAIMQGNAFVVPLPAEDSDWKGSILWPMLGRILVPEDRERLFDDPTPLSHVTGFFPLAALFNHGCNPNITYAGEAWKEGQEFPTFTFRASRDIKEGEECCYPYVSGDDEVSEPSDKGAEDGEDEDEKNDLDGIDIPDPEPSSATGTPSTSTSGSSDIAVGAGGGAETTTSSSGNSSNSDSSEDAQTKAAKKLARDVARRRYKLLLTYRFRCTCDRCCREIPSLKLGEDPSSSGSADPLARHFPYGVGITGIKAFYKMGGKYPQGG